VGPTLLRRRSNDFVSKIRSGDARYGRGPAQFVYQAPRRLGLFIHGTCRHFENSVVPLPGSVAVAVMKVPDLKVLANVTAMVATASTARHHRREHGIGWRSHGLPLVLETGKFGRGHWLYSLSKIDESSNRMSVTNSCGMYWRRLASTNSREAPILTL